MKTVTTFRLSRWVLVAWGGRCVRLKGLQRRLRRNYCKVLECRLGGDVKKEENAAGAESGRWLEDEKKGLKVNLGRKFSWGIRKLERTREGR
jgi:hypothetical protein